MAGRIWPAGRRLPMHVIRQLSYSASGLGFAANPEAIAVEVANFCVMIAA